MSAQVTMIVDLLEQVTLHLHKPLGALILLVCLDYITGVCVAIREKKLSSKIGAKGIAKKIMVFAMVGVSVIVDGLLIGGGLSLSSATILFYCANELISICENAARIGLPLPKKLTDCLKNFRKGLQQDESKADSKSNKNS